jgi:hypothetical protein
MLRNIQLGSHTVNFIKKTIEVPPKPLNFIPLDLLEKSLKGYNESHFSHYIIDLFGKEKGSALLLKYFVGRSRMHEGKANIFWRIDVNQNVRTGKIMIYDPNTGKRKKDVLPTWVHTLKDSKRNPLFPDFNYELSFFGEHLIKEFPERPIAICESEKTAIIASFFMPQLNWLATGGANGCKWREYKVFKVLKSKQVILFPDFGFYNRKTGKTCYQEWKERGAVIMDRIDCEIKVSTVLENSHMLVKRDPKTGIALTDNEYPLIWDL